MLSRLSAANSHDRLIEEPDNRGPYKRGCTVQRMVKYDVTLNRFPPLQNPGYGSGR